MFSKDDLEKARERTFDHCAKKYPDGPRRNACVTGAATVDYVLTRRWTIRIFPGMSGRKKRRR